MKYKEFIKSHTTINENFLDTFLGFYNENTLPNDIMIDLDIIANWLKASRKSLRRTLIRSYTKDVDYTIETVKYTGSSNKNGGLRHKNIVKISSDCLKRLCLLTRSKNGERVRTYFIQLESLVMKYHHFVKDGLREQLGIVNKNKDHLKNAKGGILYILKPSDATDENVYKFGKTNNLKDRLATYNTGRVNAYPADTI
jgi:phage anti-repressor protein